MWKQAGGHAIHMELSPGKSHAWTGWRMEVLSWSFPSHQRLSLLLSLEDPRLVRISLFHQENEANPLEKWINTGSLLWTQQFQCRSTTLGKVKGKPKCVTQSQSLLMKKYVPTGESRSTHPNHFFSPQSFLCLLYISLKGLRISRTAISVQGIASCSPTTKTSKELYLTFF